VGGVGMAWGQTLTQGRVGWLGWLVGNLAVGLML